MEEKFVQNNQGAYTAVNFITDNACKFIHMYNRNEQTTDFCL